MKREKLPDEVLSPPPRMDIGRAKNRPTLTRITDLKAFQKELNFSPGNSELGYFEKKFKRCDSGPPEKCPYRYFGYVRVRLQCRPTSGTVESAVTRASLGNLKRAKVKWRLGKQRGRTKTSRDGFLVIRNISHRSLLKRNIQLISKGNALSVALKSANRLVLPCYWCGR